MPSQHSAGARILVIAKMLDVYNNSLLNGNFLLAANRLKTIATMTGFEKKLIVPSNKVLFIADLDKLERWIYEHEDEVMTAYHLFLQRYGNDRNPFKFDETRAEQKSGKGTKPKTRKVDFSLGGEVNG